KSPSAFSLLFPSIPLFRTFQVTAPLQNSFRFLKISAENQPFSLSKKKYGFSVYFSCKSFTFLLEYLCYVT
ncbi:MAG: hypothetical protein IJY76_01240, partial [Anaerotignum sp.]|nr:hypothetical protein [Anaerotignum sp.]